MHSKKSARRLSKDGNAYSNPVGISTFVENHTHIGMQSWTNDFAGYKHLFSRNWNEVISIGVRYLRLIRKKCKTDENFSNSKPYCHKFLTIERIELDYKHRDYKINLHAIVYS